MPVDPIEYVKLWQVHSNLLWSRLQTVALLHTGVLVGWYNLQKESRWTLANLVLVFGLIVSVFVIAIMVRDSQYLDVLRRLSGDAFPTTNKSAPSGRGCGYLIVITLMVGELLLLLGLH